MSMERHCKNALEEENQRLREENDRLMDIVVQMKCTLNRLVKEYITEVNSEERQRRRVSLGEDQRKMAVHRWKVVLSESCLRRNQRNYVRKEENSGRLACKRGRQLG